ncbi:MAG: hypothetical protein HKL92_04885 [Candidatus Eremiobacteraeota bacterium]|nr:hypothetical protein [Candidatus Eremiobacteraeota bacterium]
MKANMEMAGPRRGEFRRRFRRRRFRRRTIRMEGDSHAAHIERRLAGNIRRHLGGREKSNLAQRHRSRYQGYGPKNHCCILAARALR